jgi:hypothetical protein
VYGLGPSLVSQVSFFCGPESIVPGDCLGTLQKAQDELRAAERVFQACVDAENANGYAEYKLGYDAYCKAYADCTNPNGCTLPAKPPLWK